MGRKIIINAVKNYVSVDEEEVREVKRWINSTLFEEHCFLADWDEGWVMKIFSSIDSVPDPETRRDLTGQVLQFFARMEHFIEYPDDQ